MTASDLSENKTKILIGIGIGAAVGIGVALSRQKNDRWASAKVISKKVAENSGDLADAVRGILDHVQLIYAESRKVAEEVSGLWHHGRRLVRS